jgi:hypothetical protein
MKTYTKTLGEQLSEKARKSDEPISITPHYWGSKLWNDGKAYFVLSYVGTFGGQKEKSVRIPALALRDCNSIEELEELLQPTNDFADGDPMNYNPRDVRPCELDLKKADIALNSPNRELGKSSFDTNDK